MKLCILHVFLGIFAISSVRGDSCSEMIDQMNSYRALHQDTPPLKCNETLTKRIQGAIDTIADKEKMTIKSIQNHFESRNFLKNSEEEEPVGVTFHFVKVENGEPTRGQAQVQAVDSWYAQETCYDYNNPKLFECKEECKETLVIDDVEYRICTVFPIQFTQMVWKTSKEVGVGSGYLTYGEDKWFYLVVFYTPPGNNVIDIDDNVMPKN